MKQLLRPWLLLAIVPLIFFSCEDDESEVIASSQTIALLSTSGTILEGGTASYSVIFLGLPEEQTTDITVNYSITGDGNNTYNASVTIPAGEQSVEFDVAIPDDNVLDVDTTNILLTLTDASGGFQINENFPQNQNEMLLLEDTKFIGVENDTIGISEDFSETGDTLFIPINITNALDDAVTLDYTLSGTATPGIDYELLSADPIVMASGSESASVAIRIINDLVDEDPFETIIFNIDDITLADTDDEETFLLEGDINRVIVYNVTDNTKSFAFTRDETDTLVVTQASTFTIEVSHSGNIGDNVTLFFDDNLPAGVMTNNTSNDLTFSPVERTRSFQIVVDESAFTGTDVIGTYSISNIDQNGDSEVDIADANDTIVVKIVNE